MSNNKQIKHLVVFGTPNYNNAINSLVKSSKNFFDRIHIFSPEDIDETFKNNNINILSQPKGAGYWLWKPYFINQVLKSVEYDNIVFYIDAGNIFVQNPSWVYENFDKNEGIILFDNRDHDNRMNNPPNRNLNWTKRDCYIIMNLDEKKHIDNFQCNASYQIYKKNKKSLDFIEELLFWCQNDNALTDAPNILGENYPGYQDHRHDQSILSLLASKYEFKLEIDPSQYGKYASENPIQIFEHHRNPNYTYKE